MKVAVTGAAGFIGTNLLHQLVADGHEVTAIDRAVPALTPSDCVTWVEGDVLDLDGMAAALDGAEVVYHLAAMITLKQEDPVVWRLNTEGVATVAEAALTVGARRMVHCSSVHSFDQTNCGGVLSETSPRADDESGLPVYDRSKYAGELELDRFIDKGLDAVKCNPTGVYGPVDHAGRLSRLNKMVRDSALGRVPLSVGGGFDLVDVRDVANGLVLASTNGRTGENYLLAGHMVQLHDLMKLGARAAGRRGPLFAVPLWVLKAIMPIAEPIGSLFGSDVMSESALGAIFAQPVVDSSKARTELGYTPRSSEETIRDLVAYYVRAGLLDR
ncbi:MAG: NAD-dependent epimerase/dehydratase family protein [Mycobacteriaceae bacterium]